LEHVHLIGIGGSGLSAIARVLLERGYKVSGSDRQLSSVTSSLAQSGATIFQGHDPHHISGADLVVRSSAISDDNSEVVAAMKEGIPVMKRSEFLGEIIQDHFCIAVAGTHGKTTTTAMIAWMLSNAGRAPSYILGGTSTNLGTNAHAGEGEEFVIEADEYDHMFLGLRPDIAVITNIEHDHPDCFPTARDYRDAFFQFALQIKEGGLLVICADDPGAALLVEEIRNMKSLSQTLRVKTYSLSDLKINGSETGGQAFLYKKQRMILQVPGFHNLQNSLAALLVAEEIGLSLEVGTASLVRFQGTSRRFEMMGEAAGVIVINDYAHHPTEIKATLVTARQRFHEHRIWALWQPHTYSRTRQLSGEFSEAFEDADFVVVTDVFAAREPKPADGFTAQVIVNRMVTSGKPHGASGEVYYIPELDRVTPFLLERLVPGDVLVILSAGDADKIGKNVLDNIATPDISCSGQ